MKMAVKQMNKIDKDALLGLTSRQAEKNLREYGENVLKGGKKVRAGKILASQFKDVLTMILLFSIRCDGRHYRGVYHHGNRLLKRPAGVFAGIQDGKDYCRPAPDGRPHLHRPARRKA